MLTAESEMICPPLPGSSPATHLDHLHDLVQHECVVRKVQVAMLQQHAHAAGAVHHTGLRRGHHGDIGCLARHAGTLSHEHLHLRQVLLTRLEDGHNLHNTWEAAGGESTACHFYL